MQESWDKEVSEAFPYLEDLGMVARKHPYAMLTAIISIATVVMICVTTLGVSIIGGVFIMYGSMRSIETQQTAILSRLDQQDNENKLTRTYNATVLSRQNFMVGLMDPKQQKQMNEYDKANPVRFPDKPKQEKQENP